MRESPVVRVVAAVWWRGDRVLLAQRPAHKRHGGLWEFPGGKVEAGESDAEAIARELAEELAVQVLTVGAALAVHRDPGSAFEVAFLPVTAAGEPEAREHAAVAFCCLDEVSRIPLAPSDRAFFAGLDASKDAADCSDARPDRGDCAGHAQRKA